MKQLRWIMLFLLLPVLVFAQFRTQGKPVNLVSLLNTPAQLQRAAAGVLGLDPSRLHIYQSYQMSYFSMGSSGFTRGMYLNTMTYDFSFPVSVAVQWGYAHQPFAGSKSPYLKDGLFISGAQLRYQPTKNILLQMDYVHNPYQYNQNPYYYPAFQGW